ncbi:asparaginyl-tRNA synthetase, putative [Eimeria necatrix]|uniref:asparagine--tRNA ligase n=1 Tax=Eimeria necatrix TaxID=51315 RepID=U6MKI9_9EIME|nr:asparaginyl-tRNA synthetase, putative [Eimeria necatrix]CDJ62165.1 asparaginyl-tRNA synthetase, putative [Eimeria necatrix]
MTMAGSAPSPPSLPPVSETAALSYVQPIAVYGPGGGRMRLAALLASCAAATFIGRQVTVCGWSRSIRKQGGGSLCFVVLTDGSCAANLQVVVNKTIPKFDELIKCGVGCSFKFCGRVVESPAKGQPIELQVAEPERGDSITILGTTDAAKYPLAKKEHSREYLREIAHLRPRTQLMGAVARIRSQLSMATHRFFQERGFQYIHTPIITASDCEGAGEMFSVSTLLPEDPKKAVPVNAKGEIDYAKDFFSRHAYLTVSGQLAVEPYCCALADVYTFGPTFRAENSHTSRHLAEFWMVEPEIAFADLQDDMQLAEQYVKFCVKSCLDNCSGEIDWFEKNQEEGLRARLENILAAPFERLTYTDAVVRLQREEAEGRVKFQEKVEWGMDLGSEHERYLTEQLAKKPVIVHDYPKDIKAFYMKQNEDGKTVRAMDVLVPKIGELIGGSQREEDLEKLDRMIKEKGLNLDSYWWYRELRSYGTVPHAGFGLGFERLIMLVTGIENIRDTIPYPRYPGHAEF